MHHPTPTGATYVVTALSHDSSAAFDVNATGQVLVYVASRGYVLWDGDQTTELHGLPDSWETEAFAVNDAGQVVGWSGRFPYGMHAVRWENGQITTLGELDGGISRALAINNAGQVVGTSGAFRDPQAVLWDGGRITALGDAGDINFESYAFGINETGQVVGCVSPMGGDRQAVLWDADQVTAFADLPGGKGSCALGINDSGLVVGWATTSEGKQRAALWKDGQVTELAGLGSGECEARAINNANQIVGWSTTTAEDRHAVLWEGAKVTDLGTYPGHSSSEALAINESGQIVGTSAKTIGDNEERRAVRWERSSDVVHSPPSG